MISTTHSSVALCWTPPRNDGGSAVSNYVIEMRASGAAYWQVCNAGERVAEPHVVVADLIEGSTYEFRVYAENRTGRSDASAPSDRIVVRDAISKWRPLSADTRTAANGSRQES